jgi:hypothetical protein
MGPHDLTAPVGAVYPEHGQPSVADTMARMSVRNAPVVTVLARRLAFEHRHPEVTISPSGQTASGLWEADWPGRARDELARHDTCAGLLDYLEARFDGDDLTAEAI